MAASLPPGKDEDGVGSCETANASRFACGFRRRRGKGRAQGAVAYWDNIDIVDQAATVVDLLARKPEDVSKRFAEGDPLIREALTRGKVIYERHG